MNDVFVNVVADKNNHFQGPPITTDGSVNYVFHTSHLTPNLFCDCECGRDLISNFSVTILIRCKIDGSIVIRDSGLIVLVDPFTFKHLGNKVINNPKAVLIQMSQDEADQIEKIFPQKTK